MTYELFNYWRSSSSWRVRVVLAFKGLSYDYTAVHLIQDGGAQNTESFGEKNPMHQVPVLKLVDASGEDVFLGQSLALMEYLEEVHPTPTMLPGDAINRARIRQLSEIINSGTQPLQNLSLIQHIRDELGLDHVAFCRNWIHKGLAAYQELAQHTAGQYSVGDDLTFADACLVPQLYNARRFSLDLEPFKLLTDIEARCLEHPSFQAAKPDAQPDAVV